MGVSTDGSICYGIWFGEEDFEFPWSTEKFYHDIDDWWAMQNNFLDGMNYEEFSAKFPEKNYFAERKECFKAHPCPIGVVNVCSCEYSMEILAVADSVRTCSRGYPTQLNIVELLATVTKESHADLLAFCDKYNIDIGDNEPQWWLGSLWC